MIAAVTGGAGFIGSHLVRALLREGHQVRIVDNFFSGKRENVPSNVDLVEGDVTDYRNARKGTKGVDVVFHLAAIPWVQYSITNPLEAWRANAHSTFITLRAAARHNVKRVVIASSCAVYGDPISPYGEAKQKSENFATYWHKSGKFETVCLRFFNVYGDRINDESAYSRVVPAFIRQVLLGEPMKVNGDGLQTRDFVHVDDVVASLLAAAVLPGLSGRSIDIATGAPTSILDLGKAIAKLAGVEPKFSHGPALSGEMRFVSPDVTAMKKLLGITEVLSLEKGLSRSIQPSYK